MKRFIAKFCEAKFTAALNYILYIIILVAVTGFYSCGGKEQVRQMTPQDLLWAAVDENNPEKATDALTHKANPNALNKDRRNPAMVAAEKGHKEVLLVLLAPKESFAEESEKQKKRIAFPEFVNKSGRKEFDWIARSLPDALEGSLAEVFVFERTAEPFTQKKSQELLKKHKELSPAMLKTLSETTKAGFVITGEYQAKDEKLSIDVFLYSAVTQQKLLEVNAVSRLDASIFDAIDLATGDLVKSMQQAATSKAGAWYQDIRLKSDQPEILTDLSQEDRRGNTIVTIAAQKKQQEILRLLLLKGADFQGELLKAINYREVAVATELVAAMPELNFRYSGGKTPLHQAAYKGLLPVVQALLEKKVPVDAVDMYGFTPLLYAAQEGHLEVVKFLVQNGANYRHADYLGLTVTEAARRRNQNAVVNYLKSL